MSISVSRISIFLAKIQKRLERGDITARLVRGTFWASIGALVSRVFAMIASIIVVRLLGREGYGEMGMIYSTMGMFGVFAGFGLGSAATKFIAQYRLNDPTRTGRTIKLITISSLVSAGGMAGLVIVLAPWLAQHGLNRPDMVPLLYAGALLLFFSQLAGVQQGVLAGFEAFRKSATISLYQGILSPFITVPLVWLYKVEGAIAAFTITMAVTLLLCLLAIPAEIQKHKVDIRESLRNCWDEHAILIKFALPAMLSQSLVLPVTWLTNLMLVNSPGGFGELGLFNAANQWRQVIMFIPSLLSSAMLPLLSQTHAQDDKTDFTRLAAMNLRIIWIVALPLTVIMITMGKPLASLFGKEFAGAAPLISVLMVSCFLTLVNNTVGSALSGSGKMWVGAAMNAGWALVLVTASWLLIPVAGGLGLAGAYLLAYIFHTGWQMSFVEIKLAPSAISSQWKLILGTIAILGLSTFFTITPAGNIVFYLFFVIFSFLPLIHFLHKRLRIFL